MLLVYHYWLIMVSEHFAENEIMSGVIHNAGQLFNKSHWKWFSHNYSFKNTKNRNNIMQLLQSHAFNDVNLTKTKQFLHHRVNQIITRNNNSMTKNFLFSHLPLHFFFVFTFPFF